MESKSLVPSAAHFLLEPLLTAEEVAEWLKVTKHRVWELARDCQLRVVILGDRQYRYTRSSVEEFIRNGGFDPNRRPVDQYLFRFKRSKDD